jgi:hypothetical protein
MCFLVVFPLTCLIHSKAVESICDEERTVLLSNFRGQNENALRTQLKGFEKHSKHEALADIYESIDELKYYREHFIKL